MTTVAIVQARMTSTRLPGKVLADLQGRPMLAYMLARVRRAARLDAVWVATTVNATDDPVAALCDSLGVPVFRGDEGDVLGRYVAAAAVAEADAVVRLTADCPLADPAVIDEAVRLFADGGCDYLSNAMKRTFPDGLDVEVFSRRTLAVSDREAQLPFHREHVTPYMRAGVYKDIPTGDFKVGHILAPADFSHLRWTVDTAQDLAHVRALAAELPDDHGWMQAIALLTRRPQLLGRDAPPPVRLRAARPDDAGLLFDWVNRADSLAGKLKTTAPIARREHDAWFARKLASDDAAIWIAELGGTPVGQVRLELGDGALHVDIYVKPGQRQKGVGLAMLEAARSEAAARWPGVPLKAWIKLDNRASRQLFASAGYAEPVVAPGHLILQREPATPETR